MKIGIDARLWNESGVGRYTRNLVYHLQKLDKTNEYRLFALSENRKKIQAEISNKKFQIVTADVRWHTVSEQIKLPSILGKENLDLMHFSYFSVPILWNKPFVVTIHDLILHHFPTGQASTLSFPIYQLKLLGYRYVISQAAKKAKKIITVSNATKQEIVDHLDVSKEKIAVIYEGVNINTSMSKNTGELRIQGKYFLYVGNAYPHKNLGRLLEAFIKLPVAMQGIKLVFVGKEDFFYKRLKQKVKIPQDESVVFFGEATDEELADLYTNALAVVLPSLMEGFGLPALEAMSYKCPILVSDIPVFKEICNNAALYVDPYSIEDIANKMRVITLQSDAVKKRTSDGLKIAENFSWETMAKQTLTIYESCIRL